MYYTNADVIAAAKQSSLVILQLADNLEDDVTALVSTTVITHLADIANLCAYRVKDTLVVLQGGSQHYDEVMLQARPAVGTEYFGEAIYAHLRSAYFDGTCGFRLVLDEVDEGVLADMAVTKGAVTEFFNTTCNPDYLHMTYAGDAYVLRVQD